MAKHKKPQAPPKAPEPEDDDLVLEEEVVEEEVVEEEIVEDDAVEEDLFEEDAVEEEALEEEVLEEDDDQMLYEEEATEEVMEQDEEVEEFEETEEEVVESEDGEDLSSLADLGEEEEAVEEEEGEGVSQFAGVGATLDADEEEEDEEDEDEEEDSYQGPLQPKVSITNIVLMVLNLIATGTFFYFMLDDFQKRQAWSYAVLMRDMRYFGLPTEEEELGPAMGRVTLPKAKLSSDQLKTAASQRNAKGDSFAPVDELLRPRVKPSQITEAMLKEHFRFQRFKDKEEDPTAPAAVVNASQVGLITTVEKEMRYFQSIAWDEMAKATQEYVEGLKEEDKRTQALTAFFSMVPDLKRAQIIETKVNEAKNKALTDLAQEAILRRLIYDALAPIELYRPGDSKVDFLDKIGDPSVSMDDLKRRMNLRLEAAIAKEYNPEVHFGKDWENLQRNTAEKRQTSAFTLLSFAQIRTPAKKLVFPYLLARTQCVMGMHDFANVCPDYIAQLKALELRYAQEIVLDRNRFVDEYQSIVRQIVAILPEIDHQRFTLEFLTNSTKKLEKLVKDRNNDVQSLINKIVTARQTSLKVMDELDQMQAQLFRAQVQLANAEQVNFRLEADIAQAQKKLKGVKKP